MTNSMNEETRSHIVNFRQIDDDQCLGCRHHGAFEFRRIRNPHNSACQVAGSRLAHASPSPVCLSFIGQFLNRRPVATRVGGCAGGGRMGLAVVPPARLELHILTDNRFSYHFGFRRPVEGSWSGLSLHHRPMPLGAARLAACRTGG
jgi:hypothetical protein